MMRGVFFLCTDIFEQWFEISVDVVPVLKLFAFICMYEIFAVRVHIVPVFKKTDIPYLQLALYGYRLLFYSP